MGPRRQHAAVIPRNNGSTNNSVVAKREAIALRIHGNLRLTSNTFGLMRYILQLQALMT